MVYFVPTGDIIDIHTCVYVYGDMNQFICIDDGIDSVGIGLWHKCKRLFKWKYLAIQNLANLQCLLGGGGGQNYE